MTERRGTKALELWCRRITDGYPGVNVQNMTTSWRDGLAFCAMIHHFRPDLIDFNSLNKDDVYDNNELAFRTAAEHLGIPALLDAEDMASCSIPDRLSILTYLSQFYQNFGGSSPSRLALSRTKESTNEGITPVSPTSPTKPTKMGPRVGMRREPCAVCGMPVFLAEKLMISRTPYHRTCFRCARCNNQLTPGNYYETEEGQYCCETCPDEEETKSPKNPVLHQAYNDAVILGHEDESKKDASFTTGYQRSLSDEQKTERILDRVPQTLSAEETRRESLVAENISHSAQMRLNFMTKNLLTENRDEETEYSSSNDGDRSSMIDGVEEDEAESREDSLPPGGSFENSRSPKGSPSTTKKTGDGRVDAEEMPSEIQDVRISNSDGSNVDISRSSGSKAHEDRVGSDYLENRLHVKEDDDKTNNSFDTADNEATNDSHRCSPLDDKNALLDGQDTKDTLDLNIDYDVDKRPETIVDTGRCLSLVQRRLKMFENSNIEETTISSSSKNVERKILPEVDLKIEDNREELSQNETDLCNRQESKIKEDIDASTKIEEEKSSERTLDTSVSEDKLDRSLPPIVPRRVALEVRKAERLKKKNAETTVLHASGIDLSAEENYPEDLNPFKSDEEDNDEKVGDNFEKSRSGKVSTNPFGSSDEDEDEDVVERPKIVAPPRPAARSIVIGNKWKDETIDIIKEEGTTKRRLKAPQINLNPFWSDDDEDHESDDECGVHSLTANTPIPKPRSIKQTPDTFLSQRKTDLHRGDIYASNSSLGSTGSASTPGGTYRKKKPAPPPPIVNELFASGADSFLSPNRGANSFTGSNNSLRATPRTRKAKPAPPPPMPTSTPCGANLVANLSLTESPITDIGKIIDRHDYEVWDDRKIDKDEANRNKQSMTTISCDETNPYSPYTDKSAQGKWKRKKGPAPARPIPHRRKIKVMSLKDVKLELDEIEVQQQGLEKQGVRLEQLIRDKAETGNATEETSLEMDVEELVLELFALVNEKNELFRRQAELMLLRRQQRLEEEHADIEYQIRCLLCQPEATKTDFDKQREETLIQRLVEIVERRNEIVECLEMDRRREVEEDRSINTRMGLYAAKTKGDFAKELEEDDNNRSRKSKKSKLKEKAKEKILRKVHKKDADKDIDESEVKLKRQNKRKWF